MCTLSLKNQINLKVLHPPSRKRPWKLPSKCVDNTQDSGLTLLFLNFKCLGCALSHSLEERDVGKASDGKWVLVCQALKRRFDQLQWADAKLGPIKTESLESPMKSGATSSPNAATHHRDVKIWGHDFNCVPNLWLELKCEIACVSTRKQSESTFFVMLRSACFCRYIVQNTHGGVTSWRLQVGFHRNVLLQVSFIPQCSTLRIHAEGPSGQTSLSLSLPLTGLMSYDSYVI